MGSRHQVAITPFSIQASLDNNADTSYTDKYQEHIACSYGYKVVCNDDRFSKPVQIYQGENEVYRFIVKMLQGVEYPKKNMKKTL